MTTSEIRRSLKLRSTVVALSLLAVLAPSAAFAKIKAPERAAFAASFDKTSYPAGAAVRVLTSVAIAPGWHVNSTKPTFEYLIPTQITLQLPEDWGPYEFVYPPSKVAKFGFADEPLSVYEGTFAPDASFRIPGKTSAGEYPVTAVLFYQACDDSQCLPPVETQVAMTLVVGAEGTAVPAPVATPPKVEEAGAPSTLPSALPRPAAVPAKPVHGLGWALALALLGGLILNAMPCVLPVLSLKVFGIVRASGLGRGEVARSMLLSAAGIVVSFWLLAIAAIAAKGAGAAVGWGIQFQRPGFVAFLAAVIVLFSLNLWGLFEIPLPGALARLGLDHMGGAGANVEKEGFAGHFASGLLATLMATPCSAPFLGTAIGFALAQSAPAIFAIFTAIGIGMALPYLLFATFPGAARLLPKPGTWMDTLKGTLGFLLAGAAIWLFYVLASQIPSARLAGVQLALLALALFAWLGSRNRYGKAGARAFAIVAVLIAGAAAVAIASSSGAAPTHETAAAAGNAPKGLIEWVPFDRAAAEDLAAQGTTVFVDVTADWCFTCKANEKFILDTPEVAKAFKDHNVVAMRADWTNRDDSIGAYLAEHGRYGIPFYALYRQGQPPYVFSELLTQKAVLEALDSAE